ncbi:ATP-binding cassette domain-containing protein [uncultured Clostridium sp.]|uniref:ATP-binding cassette domain-containing protein n=1 Tax=uncultured Clostridium sp. TaxID=59620 RepID=UPI00272E4B78|nr:ATP-binding cassette domain-containing protein [uncultured Clostridium sp.]
MKLEIKDLRKSFSGNEVLHGISFSVESGKALGLLGRNGAGKTTTIRILMDVFKSDSGEILLDGKPLYLKIIKLDIFLKKEVYILRKR